MDMKNKWQRRIIITLLILGIGVGFFAYQFRVPHQACACLPPEYFAHFTEAAAFDIIRTRLEAVGLDFDGEVPSYYIERWGGRRWGGNTGIDLFDAERNIAITFINMYEDATSSVTDEGGSYRWISDNIETEFSETFDEISFGVFYNPSSWRPWRDQNRWRLRPHTAEEVEFLTERLEIQIQDFIEKLRDNGVIE